MSTLHNFSLICGKLETKTAAHPDLMSLLMATDRVARQAQTGACQS